MKGIHFLYFYLGMLIGVVAYAVLGIMFAIVTFDLAGGQNLREIQGQRWLLFFLTVMLAFVLFHFSLTWAREKLLLMVYGLRTVLLVAVISALGYLIDIYWYNDFDETVWLQTDEKPFRMAAALSTGDKLPGKNRKEIRQLLGEPTKVYDDPDTGNGSMMYDVKEEWTLILYITNDKVTEVVLQRPSMMT